MTGTKPGYNSVTRTSAGTTAGGRGLPDAGRTSALLRLSGKAKVGKTLTRHVRSPDCPAADATLHYAWYAGQSKAIKPKANGRHAEAEERSSAGKRIRVLVSVTVPG